MTMHEEIKRMEGMGFQFQIPIHENLALAVIKPMVTDSIKHAEIDQCYEAIIGEHQDRWAVMIETYMCNKEGI